MREIGLLQAIRRTIQGLLSTFLLGKVASIPEINLKVVAEWFLVCKESYPGANFGVLYRVQSGDTDIESALLAEPSIEQEYRFFQGLFDRDVKCLVARQISSKKVSSEILQLLGDQEMVMFD